MSYFDGYFGNLSGLGLPYFDGYFGLDGAPPVVTPEPALFTALLTADPKYDATVLSPQYDCTVLSPVYEAKL